MVAEEEEEDTTWAQQAERGLNEAKPLEASFFFFFKHGAKVSYSLVKYAPEGYLQHEIIIL